MKWFKLYSRSISPVEVVRETNDFVIIMSEGIVPRECRELKIARSRWSPNYYRTFEEAKKELIDRLQREYDAAVSDVTRVTGQLREAGALKEPQ